MENMNGEIESLEGKGRKRRRGRKGERGEVKERGRGREGKVRRNVYRE